MQSLSVGGGGIALSEAGKKGCNLALSEKLLPVSARISSRRGVTFWWIVNLRQGAGCTQSPSKHLDY